MSKLTKKDVEHVARLAKLNLTPSEVDTYLKQLAEVVSYVGELKGVNTDSSEPTSQTTGLENISRPDEQKSEQTLTQERALSGTDKTHNGFFKVEAILTEKTDK